MIKANDKYYIVKDPKLPSAQSDFDLQSPMFQVYIKPQSLCSHPQIVYLTPYDSLYISLRDGFDMNTGEPIHKYNTDTGAITLETNIILVTTKQLIQSIFKSMRILISKPILEQKLTICTLIIFGNFKLLL